MLYIANLRPESPEYARFLEFLSSEPNLRQEWYEDADGQHEEGIHYVVSYYAPSRSEPVPAAWAGYTDTRINAQRALKFVNNYCRRDFRQGRIDFYGFAYRYRHETVLIPSGLHAETFLFPDPIPRHEADGWQKDIPDPDVGNFGVWEPGNGIEPKVWQRLTWNPNHQQ